MGFLKKVVKEEPVEPTAGAMGMPYVDLATYVPPSRRRGREMMVKVAEIDGYEDLRMLTNYVYEGNMLVLDYTAIANDDLTLRRVISELKRLVQDVDGDIAGVGKNLLLVTPRGVKIDRQKIRRGYL